MVAKKNRKAGLPLSTRLVDVSFSPLLVSVSSKSGSLFPISLPTLTFADVSGVGGAAAGADSDGDPQAAANSAAIVSATNAVINL